MLVTVTFAPGMTAPDWSVTVPRKSPELVSDMADKGRTEYQDRRLNQVAALFV